MFKSRLARIRTCPDLEEPALLVKAEEPGGEEGGEFCDRFLVRVFGLLVTVSDHFASRWATEMFFLLLIYAPKC